MKKLILWVLSLTGAGKVVDPVRRFISGKGTYLSACAIGVPALIVILQRFSEYGLPYLATLLTSGEWITLMGAIATIRLRIAITKAADPAKDPNLRPDK